jgi:hypothetical protein
MNDILWHFENNWKKIYIVLESNFVLYDNVLSMFCFIVQFGGRAVVLWQNDGAGAGFHRMGEDKSQKRQHFNSQDLVLFTIFMNFNLFTSNSR